MLSHSHVFESKRRVGSTAILEIIKHMPNGDYYP